MNRCYESNLISSYVKYSQNFARVVRQICGASVEVIKRLTETFEVLPKRWVVERTFGWLNRYRRLSKREFDETQRRMKNKKSGVGSQESGENRTRRESGFLDFYQLSAII